MPAENYSPAQYDALISSIYQGPLVQPAWRGFLPLLCQELNALSVSLLLRLPVSGDEGLIFNYHSGSDDCDLADPADWQASAYRQHFFALDPFIDLPLERVVTLAELSDETSLKDSEYYRQYLAPAGIMHIVGMDTREPEGLLARLRISRGSQALAFNNCDKVLLERLLPHLQRALQIYGRLNRTELERDLYANTVDRMAVGTIILDNCGRLLNANTLATQLMEQRDGLRQSQRQLIVGDRQQAVEFQQLVDRSLSRKPEQPGVAEAMRVSRPSGKADLGLLIRPIDSERNEGQTQPAVAIFISDPEQQPESSQQLITRLFAFTPAEACLAMQLAQGLSLAESSQQSGISQHTARAQLKAIFTKTRVSRQAELVRLLVKSVANLG